MLDLTFYMASTGYLDASRTDQPGREPITRQLLRDFQEVDVHKEEVPNGDWQAMLEKGKNRRNRGMTR